MGASSDQLFMRQMTNACRCPPGGRKGCTAVDGLLWARSLTGCPDEYVGGFLCPLSVRRENFNI